MAPLFDVKDRRLEGGTCTVKQGLGLKCRDGIKCLFLCVLIRRTLARKHCPLQFVYSSVLVVASFVITPVQRRPRQHVLFSSCSTAPPPHPPLARERELLIMLLFTHKQNYSSKCKSFWLTKGRQLFRVCANSMTASVLFFSPPTTTPASSIKFFHHRRFPRSLAARRCTFFYLQSSARWLTGFFTSEPTLLLYQLPAAWLNYLKTWDSDGVDLLNTAPSIILPMKWCRGETLQTFPFWPRDLDILIFFVLACFLSF